MSVGLLITLSFYSRYKDKQGIYHYGEIFPKR